MLSLLEANFRDWERLFFVPDLIAAMLRYDDCCYNCNPPRRGACGTCDNSYYQCAWANLRGFPPENSIAYTYGSSWLCNDKRASDIPQFSCGDVLWAAC